MAESNRQNPAEESLERIDVNRASAKVLTQLPGVGISLARAIVNHRQRHGLFTAFAELREVKQFPVERLDEIRRRAVLGGLEGFPPVRHAESTHLDRLLKKTGGYTKALRSTRGKDRVHETVGHRPQKVA